MRRALTALLLAALTISPAFAAKKKQPVIKQNPACYEITKNRVGNVPSGYRDVRVLLEVPVPEDQDPQEVAKRATFIFGLHMSAMNVRLERDDEWVAGIGVCTRDFISPDGRFYPAGTVWFQVRALVEEVGKESYTLRTHLRLPQRIVAERPSAETLLSGYVGYWGEWLIGDDVTLFLWPMK